jgi:hypothetical protein
VSKPTWPGGNCREEAHRTAASYFRRLQLHLAATVTHHRCHLFLNSLCETEDAVIPDAVTDADMRRLVHQYDVGSAFKAGFFGGRPKLFIDQGTAGTDVPYDVGSSIRTRAMSYSADRRASELPRLCRWIALSGACKAVSGCAHAWTSSERGGYERRYTSTQTSTCPL